MKKSSQIFLLFFTILFLASCVIYVPYSREGRPYPGEEDYYEEEIPYSQEMDISYFYDYLSPYGVWVYQQPYGYVWIPKVTRYGWRPYTYGQWVWTDFGWTWVSRFQWGWAPFHYGRWGWDDYLGWFWVPDTIWGPSWVAWRRSSLYIGWAPLPPNVRFIPGIGIPSLPDTLSLSFWIFVEGPYFFSRDVYTYVLPVERNITIIRYTAVQTNIIVQKNRIINRGIDVEDIQRISKKRISKVTLQNSRRPGTTELSSDKVKIFKPAIEKNELARPKNVAEKSEIKDKIEESKISSTGKAKVISGEMKPLEEVQQHEKTLLEKTQQKEV